MSIMPSIELHIYSADGSQFLRAVIASNQVLRLGRAPMNGCSIPWDAMISREQRTSSA